MKESKVTRVSAPPPGPLGKPELYALSIGQVIGAGIITLIGPAIALTGLSTWLAYFVAILLGFVLIMPVVFVTSTLRLGGGYYSMLAGLASEKIAGMYAVAFFTQMISMSLFGLSLGIYAKSLWPSLNERAVGIVFITLFFVINLGGVDIMAQAQKYMTWVLIAALMMFIVLGIFKIQNPIFDFNAEGYFSGGTTGFIGAVYLFVYSTYGYSLTMNYGRDARNAKRDIPWAMLMSVPTLIILYCGVAIVGSGVLGLDVVVNQPLTLVAKHILPGPLFIAFIVGGPICALMTTMNSSMAYNCVPVAQACKDGWLPKGLAKQNKRGAYTRILTIVYLIGIIPLVLDFSVTAITSNIMLFNACLSILYTYAYLRMPKKFPEAWKKSRLHLPDKLYYVLVIISFVAYMTVLLHSISTLSLPVVVASIVAIGGCMAFGFLRSKNPNVHVETSMWDD